MHSRLSHQKCSGEAFLCHWCDRAGEGQCGHGHLFPAAPKNNLSISVKILGLFLFPWAWRAHPKPFQSQCVWCGFVEGSGTSAVKYVLLCSRTGRIFWRGYSSEVSELETCIRGISSEAVLTGYTDTPVVIRVRKATNKSVRKAELKICHERRRQGKIFNKWRSSFSPN